ncbi:hypothetical protein QVD17_24867 [Tagetes erecta]|uniref:Transmembrane protein n=1 Tax=Tagetes erecta TaxID=13708 RepID=A0AAD8NV81_TARER|nr:hypothetical protein QVD17_24867 [Tagetes erecta]
MATSVVVGHQLQSFLISIDDESRTTKSIEESSIEVVAQASLIAIVSLVVQVFIVILCSKRVQAEYDDVHDWNQIHGNSD